MKTMKVKDFEKQLKDLPVTGSFVFADLNPSSEIEANLLIKKLTNPRRKNGLSKRLFKAYSHNNKIRIWRIV